MNKPDSITHKQEAAVQNMKDQIATILRGGCEQFLGSSGQLTSEHIDSLLQATRRALTQLGFKGVSLDELTVTYNDETKQVDVEFPLPIIVKGGRVMNDESRRGT